MSAVHVSVYLSGLTAAAQQWWLDGLVAHHWVEHLQNEKTVYWRGSMADQSK